MSQLCTRVTGAPYRLIGVFFFNDTATTEIYTLSLHDALPISAAGARTTSASARSVSFIMWRARAAKETDRDRKSTRLNSSHQIISYAVFCLKKKNPKPIHRGPGHFLVHTTSPHCHHP